MYLTRLLFHGYCKRGRFQTSPVCPQDFGFWCFIALSKNCKGRNTFSTFVLFSRGFFGLARPVFFGYCLHLTILLASLKQLSGFHYRHDWTMWISRENGKDGCKCTFLSITLPDPIEYVKTIACLLQTLSVSLHICLTFACVIFSSFHLCPQQMLWEPTHSMLEEVDLGFDCVLSQSTTLFDVSVIFHGQIHIKSSLSRVSSAGKRCQGHVNRPKPFGCPRILIDGHHGCRVPIVVSVVGTWNLLGSGM